MITAAVGTRVELLRFEPEAPRTRDMWDALSAAAGALGIGVMATREYAGGSDLLMVWGPGAPNRFEAISRQIAAGGHVVAWDAAYWSRQTKLRVSINGAHPQAWVMLREWPRDRFERDRPPLGDVWDPNGPVIVAGIGRKARVQYGEARVLEWEASMLRQASTRRPLSQVLYRRKQADAPIPPGAHLAPDVAIDELLRGASLVITWHSNVAVDAIRFGVPVICRDGAAAAVCPSMFSAFDDPQPLPAVVRDTFLRNLAWFQWSPSEADRCWLFLMDLLS